MLLCAFQLDHSFEVLKASLTEDSFERAWEGKVARREDKLGVGVESKWEN